MVQPSHRAKSQVAGFSCPSGGVVRLPAVFDTSDFIRERIKQYKDHDIAVEGTILLGLDSHTEDSIKRLIDFVLELDLDLAEFTILTPFPHTRAFENLYREGRIFSLDWNEYSADKVTYYPKQMSAQKLQELFYYAWDTFYSQESQIVKMTKLLQKVVRKEKEDGTYQSRDRRLISRAFGREVK